MATFASPRVLNKPAGLRLHEEGVVTKPLSDIALGFDTSLIMRAEGNPRFANEFAMAFFRRVAPQRAQARQLDLPLPA